jgi:Flp pilus assembly pilin Flp
MKTLRRFWRDQSGQDMIEYALLCAALVVIVAGFIPPALGASITKVFSLVTSEMNGS